MYHFLSIIAFPHRRAHCHGISFRLGDDDDDGDGGGNKRIFVYRAKKAVEILEETIGWKPAKVDEVRDVAKVNNVRPAMVDIAEKLTGGYCSRGRNFSASAAIPSPMALSHLDADVGVIYNFAIPYLELRGREVRDAVEEEEGS